MNLKYLSIIIISAFLISCSTGEKAESENKNEEVVEESTAQEEEIELIGAAAELSADQSVYFASPEDGAELNSPVIVEFGVEGMEVEPAGALSKNKGHHHIIINGSFVPKGEVVPADDTHIHYGAGQLRDTLELEPGEYTLTMQFADGLHNSYGEQMSATINVTVN
ncbi:DUF4399 domain-containing protein [Hyphobacterium sp. CCMP332]|nr:DUF4399 domain-containing protein [Hyphobacterium sp. CCMP332]